ncbi:hypothetical protein BD779DRAFT_1553503 [Infundibulicybe gibba]|nr:hypothetical protein BD779DRAFT_1553503 [Infundibulicybe gibba]
MVASTNGDLYSPFQQTMISEEGPQSSEEGSGLHSPVFGQFPTHSDSYRIDIQHVAGILAPQYDYAPTLNVQQPSLDTTLELPSPSPQHVNYSSHYPRNQLGLDFPVPLSANSRGGPVDFRYNIPERRLPSGQPHDHLYPRPTGSSAPMPMDGDHRPPPVPASEHREPSVSAVASGSRESRKEISTVVIACRNCRSRKIRCDSTRPKCNNCVRRNNECEYDAAPKRRGPDKRPGTRQRSCKKRPADGSAPPPPKRKKTAPFDRSSASRDSIPSQTKENLTSTKRSPSTSRHPDRTPDHTLPPSQHIYPPTPGLRISTDSIPLTKQDRSPTPRRSFFKSPFPRQLDVNILQSPDASHHKFPMPSSPAIETDQRKWWASFLHQYPLRDIGADLEYLFNDTGYWLSFLNLVYFLETLYDEEERLRIQPSFILAGLAMANLMKSSETENASGGRNRALWLRDAAQEALETAWRSEWIDASLAEAALVIHLYIQVALTSLDTNDPDVSLFPRRSVPVVNIDTGTDSHHSYQKKCSCIPTDAPHPPDQFGSWVYPLPWDSSWSPRQIRDEECRRLCWSALSLIASYTSQCAALNIEPINLFLSNPANYTLLFPGEVLDRDSPSYRSSDSLSPKESVWALYCRSMLLWSFCHRLRYDSATNDEKAEFASDAWAETQSLQDSLEAHTCNLDTSLIYMCREYIYNTRMSITQLLRRLVPSSDPGTSVTPGPLFNRKQAEEWLYYQDQVIKRVKISIHHVTDRQGFPLTRRPFQVTWFVNQLAICLQLWENDRGLINALELAKSILVPVDVMNVLWPCPFHQNQSDHYRQKLAHACAVVGIEPPHPAQHSLPAPLRST